MRTVKTPRVRKPKALTNPAMATDAAALGLDAKAEDIARAADMFTNAMARMGAGTNSVAEGAGYILDRLSNNYWLMIALYRNHWIARKIVDTAAKDMIRAWPKLNSEIKPGDIKDFDRTIDKTATKHALITTISWARLFGGAGALMVIKGHEKMLAEPLDLDDVQPGAYRGLIPFDRWSGVTPDMDVSADLEHPHNFGLPVFYSVRTEGGQIQKVHHTRILRFIGKPVPTPEFQAQSRWGISVLEVVFEELRKADNMSWTILNLLFRAQIITQVNPELARMLSGATMGQQGLAMFYARMQAINDLLSNQSMLVLPKDGSLESHQYSFGGVADIYQQFQLLIAGAAELPVSRLFGRTLSGLGQSNDADERIYEEHIAQEQQFQVSPALDQLFPVIAMSEWGEVPDDLSYKYPSVRVLTEEEKATLAKDSTAAIVEAFGAGLISQKIGMMELQQLSLKTELFSNITDADIEKADDTLQPPDAGELDEMQPNAGKTLKGADVAPLDEMDYQGLRVMIENPVGSTRKGIAADRKPWKVTFRNAYGFIDGIQGADGDEIDCFVGTNLEAPEVYVIRQNKLGGGFDEEKVMLGYDSVGLATSAYFTHYDRPEEFFESIEPMSIGDFKAKYLAAK